MEPMRRCASVSAALWLLLVMVPGVVGLARGASVDVILLGGQSNADGRGSTNDLPAELQGEQTNVLLYRGSGSDGNATVPRFTLLNLRPGGSSSANQFGPEVSMGHALAASLTNPNLAIIKYAQGGTSLAADWAPDSGPKYQAFTNTVAQGIQALEAAGHTVSILSMTWMQGERDGQDSGYAPLYKDNLTAFITRMRTLYGSDMPFVIGQLHSGYSGEAWTTVQQAQQTVADADTRTAMVVTHDLSLKTDNLHYDADGLVGLGARFAAAIINLKATPVATTPGTLIYGK